MWILPIRENARRVLGAVAKVVEIGQTEYRVVAVLLFGEQELAQFPTREQAEWRITELKEEAERNPRGYIRYAVRPVKERSEKG